MYLYVVVHLTTVLVMQAALRRMTGWLNNEWGTMLGKVVVA